MIKQNQQNNNMKILKIILIVIAILVVAGLGIAMMQPAEGSIESSIVINASPESIYEEAVNIKKLDAWSPWYKIEPSAYSYEGPEEGVGATSKWDSENPDLRKGSITIIEVIPNELVKTEMKFDGMDANFGSWVKIEQDGDSSKVTWGYNYSDLGLFWRFLFGLGDMNAEMLPKFEQGLNDLKQIVESKPTPEPEIMEEEMAADSLAIEE